MGSENEYPTWDSLLKTMSNRVRKGYAPIVDHMLQQRNASAPQAPASTPILPQSNGGNAMIRYFLATTNQAAGSVIQVRPNYTTDSCEYRWSNKSKWHPMENDKTFSNWHTWALSQGWKEVAAGYDPNDLQAQDAALWGNSKPCCSGGVGGGIYIQGKWHDSTCDAIKPPPSGLLPGYNTPIPAVPQPKNYGRCTCGSSAVGSDRHSSWCDIK